MGDNTEWKAQPGNVGKWKDNATSLPLVPDASGGPLGRELGVLNLMTFYSCHICTHSSYSQVFANNLFTGSAYSTIVHVYGNFDKNILFPNRLTDLELLWKYVDWTLERSEEDGVKVSFLSIHIHATFPLIFCSKKRDLVQSHFTMLFPPIDLTPAFGVS